MNFTEVVNEVLGIVKRPDQLALIRRAINGAVSYSCQQGNFARDLDERSIAIDPAAYAQSLALSEFTRFRKFECLRPSNRNKYLKPLEAPAIFASIDGIDKEVLDTYYVAGDQVNFKLCTVAPSLLVSWYRYPPTLTDAAGTFWLLEVCPYMIIDKAASTIFNHIGDEKSAAKHEGDYRVVLLSAIQDLRYGVRHG